MKENRIPLTQESLVDYLKQKKYEVLLQEATGQAYILFSILGREFPLFIRVDTNSATLQLIMFFPISLQSTTYPNLARTLHLLNKELDWPGFCMDEVANVVYYRAAIPGPNGQIATILLDNAMTSLPIMGRIFFPVITAAVAGASMERLTTDVKETIQQMAP